MEIIKKHMIPILCILSIIFLALPIAKVSTELSSTFVEFSSDTAVTGFDSLSNNVLAYILILAPAALIAANYIASLGKYKGILAIVVPIVCMVFLVITIIRAKSTSAEASNEYASAEVTLKVGIGAILLFISYLATIVAGAVTYHDFTLDKAGMEKLKENATTFLGNTQEKLKENATTLLGNTQEIFSETVKNVSSRASTIELPKTGCSESGADAAPAIPKPAVKKSLNINRIEEILTLIEKLAQMRDSGVLSEEEFTQKKRQLLDEI